VRTPKSVKGVEDFGRIRLSKSFFVRDFLYSEIANIHGLINLPDDPDLAVQAGSKLCQELLEPLQDTFGRLGIRSGYRSPEINNLGNAKYGNCASNEADKGRHIWDQRSSDGGMGAMATVVVPWLAADRKEQGVSWTSMAWWVHDHLPYSDLQFFPKLFAFNIGWHEFPRKRITSFVAPRGLLTKPGMDNHSGNHGGEYQGYPRLLLRHELS
jgi:hypothetical protein